jgi:hypothetical protein
MNQKQVDHHANQLNPNNIAHKLATDNHANQKNPTSPAYQKSRAASTKSVKGK